MVVTAHAGRLLGRQRERAVLERLLDTARGGHGAVLVVHGEPGVGKTALLEYAVEAGEGFRVVRAAGAGGEMELDYAALQQLCSPILEFLERLPDPQRDALGVAFGLSSGHAPSPFLVGLAVLGLLSEAAEPQPLLCVVDDAQWLDGASARALSFVARRLLAERIALAPDARARPPVQDWAPGLDRCRQVGGDEQGGRAEKIGLCLEGLFMACSCPVHVSCSCPVPPPVHGPVHGPVPPPVATTGAERETAVRAAGSPPLK